MDRKKLEEKTDAELVVLSREGSVAGAYEALVNRHARRSLRRASALLGEPADAEDAVQDALVRALLKLDQLKNPESFGNWLDRIVISSCVSQLRRKHPELLDPEDYLAALDRLLDDESPEENAVAKERETALINAINELPEKYRDPVRLFHLKGHSYRNIAELLDLPIGTVQSIISRARDRLEVLLKPYYYWTPIHQF